MPLWLLIIWPIFIITVAGLLPVALDCYLENKENKKNGNSGTGAKNDK